MTETTVRRLYRSRTERTVAGICGGIAEYAGLDPTIVRVLFIVLAFVTGGTALLAYPALWLVMPQEPQAWPAAPTAKTA